MIYFIMKLCTFLMVTNVFGDQKAKSGGLSWTIGDSQSKSNQSFGIGSKPEVKNPFGQPAVQSAHQQGQGFSFQGTSGVTPGFGNVTKPSTFASLSTAAQPNTFSSQATMGMSNTFTAQPTLGNTGSTFQTGKSLASGPGTGLLSSSGPLLFGSVNNTTPGLGSSSVNIFNQNQSTHVQVAFNRAHFVREVKAMMFRQSKDFLEFAEKSSSLEDHREIFEGKTFTRCLRTLHASSEGSEASFQSYHVVVSELDEHEHALRVLTQLIDSFIEKVCAKDKNIGQIKKTFMGVRNVIKESLINLGKDAQADLKNLQAIGISAENKANDADSINNAYTDNTAFRDAQAKSIQRRLDIYDAWGSVSQEVFFILARLRAISNSSQGSQKIVQGHAEVLHMLTVAIEHCYHTLVSITDT